ncbi:MAG: hypothetical protein M0Z58_05560 [Nitrospiraceae bacterium]|nr:hypothetical protein [Nitrospiraceae bacterium]
MEKKKKKQPTDINQLAKFIVDQATTDVHGMNTPKEASPTKEKNPSAVALGRLGGLKGGKARAEKLSAAKRKEIAKKAAQSRWKK